MGLSAAVGKRSKKGRLMPFRYSKPSKDAQLFFRRAIQRDRCVGNTMHVPLADLVGHLSAKGYRPFGIYDPYRACPVVRRMNVGFTPCLAQESLTRPGPEIPAMEVLPGQ